MTRFLLIVGWLLVALDLIAAASILLGRDSGDAASRGVKPGLGAALVILGLVAAALLYWGGRGEGKASILIVASLLAAIPVALAFSLIVSPQRLLGLVYPSMREPARPMLPSPQYAHPDAAGQEAAYALVMNDFPPGQPRSRPDRARRTDPLTPRRRSPF